MYLKEISGEITRKMLKEVILSTALIIVVAEEKKRA
jgi:hypothetical protein